MDEDMEITTPTEEPAEEQAPEQPDYEAMKADIEAKTAELSKKEKALQKGFEEISRRERAIPQPRPDTTDAPELDPAAERALDAYVARKYGPTLAAGESAYYNLMDASFESAATKYGVDADAIRETVQRLGINPKSNDIRDVREAIEAAADITSKSSLDPAAIEKQVEARVREQLFKELSEKGVNIDAVVPAKASKAAEPAGTDLYEMDPDQRVAWYKAKGWVS